MLNDMSRQSSCAQWPEDTDSRADSKAEGLVSYAAIAKGQLRELTPTRDRIGLGVGASTVILVSALRCIKE